MNALSRIAIVLLTAGLFECKVESKCIAQDAGCNWLVSNLLYPRTRTAKFMIVANSGANTVSAYRMDYQASTLTEVPGSPFPAGSSPRHMVADPLGKFVYVANSTSGNISAYSVDAGSGALTQVAGSPFASGTAMYSVSVHPGGQFLYAGSETSALIYVYQINGTTGSLSQISGSPFAAPAYPGSVAVSPSGRFLYAGINNTPNGRVAAFLIANDGSLSAIAGSPFISGDDTLSVNVDQFERFVFGANYFSSNVYSYSIDQTNGALTTVGFYSAGSAPGYVTLDPLGRFAYVANSGDAVGTAAVTGYRLESTGALTQIAGSPFSAGANPIGCSVEPMGRFAFSSNTASGTISMLRIDQNTGALTKLRDYPTGASPFGTTFVPGFEF